MDKFSCTKDPDAALDFTISWVDWLAEASDTIATSAWSAEDGITIDSDSNTTTTATAWLSGGTVGERYRATNEITTVGGRTDNRTITVTVRQK